jgi:hypothetical protein
VLKTRAIPRTGSRALGMTSASLDSHPLVWELESRRPLSQAWSLESGILAVSRSIRV